MQKKYPGLYTSEKQSVQNQQKCVDALWEPKSMEANINAYNAAYQNLIDNFGLDNESEIGTLDGKGATLLKDVFKTLDFEYIQEMKPTVSKGVNVEDWEAMDRKMKKASKLLVPVTDLLAKETSKMSVAEARLTALNLDKAKAQLKEWFKRLLLSDDDDLTMSGLPFDSRMMEQVHENMRTDQLKTFYKDPAIGNKEREVIMAKLVAETWDKMFEVVQQTQPNRTKKEYDDLVKVYHEVLDPTDRYLGRLNEKARTLFLQAYWAGGAKMVTEVEVGMQKLMMWYNTMPADYCEQWQQAISLEKELKLTGEIGMFIKCTDPLFVMKIMKSVREAYCSMHFTRTAHKVLGTVHQHEYEFQVAWQDDMLKKLPDLEEEKRGLRSMMADYSDKVDNIIFKQDVIAKDKQIMKNIHEARKDWPIPAFEEIVKGIVYERLWVKEGDARQKDVDAFIGDLLKFMQSAKGDIVALENKAKTLFPSTTVSKDNPVDDLEFRRTFVTFHRGVRRRMETWAFKDALLATTDNKLDKIHHKREVVMEKMKGEFPDPIIRLMKHLIETNIPQQLEKIHSNYGDIVSRFKGEVYGAVTSAQEMTDAEYKSLVDVLQKQNPGKKYFLDRATDANLLAGFVINCGGDKIDYSLASQMNTLKKSVQIN